MLALAILAGLQQGASLAGVQTLRAEVADAAALRGDIPVGADDILLRRKQGALESLVAHRVVPWIEMNRGPLPRIWLPISC
ncbi:MAG: hypothetical protein U1E60_21120 [Reyranellaceae bacterium]